MRIATTNIYQERILRVLVHIEQHLEEKLSLSALAKVGGFSRFHFHRIFLGMTGETVKQHVKRLRMERAARRLRNTKEAVTAIAFESGYETLESFSRTFRERFGRTPSGFRKLREDALEKAEAPDVHPGLRVAPRLRVKVVTREKVEVAFMRYVGEPQGVGKAWEKISRWAGVRGIFGGGTEFVGVWHDDPEITPLRRMRCDVCVTLPRKIEASGEIGVREIAGGEYAMTRHCGPYDKLGETYARLCGVWAPKSGREIASAPAVEVYRNSPQSVESGDLITDIYLPLE
jgi:AraC family transcriptional regulator